MVDNSKFERWFQSEIQKIGAQKTGNLEKYYYENIATEEEFLEWYRETDLSSYEKPSVALDLIGLSYSREKGLQILLIRRKSHPYRNKLAFAGGFLNPNENAEEGCIREVTEELGLFLSSDRLIPLPAITTPNRDPRTWVISLPYIVYLTEEELEKAIAGDDAKEVIVYNLGKEKVSLGNLENELAFDHYDILKMALNRLSTDTKVNPNALKMIEPFTVLEASKLINLLSGAVVVTPHHFKRRYGKLVKEVGTKKSVSYRPPKEFILV